MRLARWVFWLFVAGSCAVASINADEPSLARIQQILVGKKLVDLTHAFAPGIPHWPGFPDEKRETIYWYEKGRGSMGEGFFAETFTHVGQWGTHVDPPAHFARGLRTVDQIELKEMILPLVVIDVHEEVAKNAGLHAHARAGEKMGGGRTAPFPRARSWRCGPIGRSAGPTAPRWKTRTRRAWRIIPAGAPKR